MFVIRLPNGNLKVPQSAIGHEGRVIGDVYVEIGPQDADYSRLAAQALTAEEVEQRRDRWRQEDEALRQEFLEFARRNSESPWSDSADGEGALYGARQARLATPAWPPPGEQGADDHDQDDDNRGDGYRVRLMGLTAGG
jgi:hypothetical protein